MDLIAKINPVVILALIMLILVVLNMLLWRMIWKQTAELAQIKGKGSNEKLLTDINKSIEAGIEKNIRFEDQLWGILDKLKEQEKILNDLKKSCAQPDRPFNQLNKDVPGAVNNQSPA